MARDLRQAALLVGVSLLLLGLARAVQRLGGLSGLGALGGEEAAEEMVPESQARPGDWLRWNYSRMMPCLSRAEASDGRHPNTLAQWTIIAPQPNSCGCIFDYDLELNLDLGNQARPLPVNEKNESSTLWLVFFGESTVRNFIDEVLRPVMSRLKIECVTLKDFDDSVDIRGDFDFVCQAGKYLFSYRRIWFLSISQLVHFASRPHEHKRFNNSPDEVTGHWFPPRHHPMLDQSNFQTRSWDVASVLGHSTAEFLQTRGPDGVVFSAGIWEFSAFHPEQEFYMCQANYSGLLPALFPARVRLMMKLGKARFANRFVYRSTITGNNDTRFLRLMESARLGAGEIGVHYMDFQALLRACQYRMRDAMHPTPYIMARALSSLVLHFARMADNSDTRALSERLAEMIDSSLLHIQYIEKKFRKQPYESIASCRLNKSNEANFSEPWSVNRIVT